MDDQPTMTAFPIPSNLARSARDGSHPLPSSWLEMLPHTVARLSDRWSLEVSAPFEPGGVGSWTAPARDAAGRDLVLKVGWTHDEALHEGAALRLWGGRGAVLLHDEWVEGETTALLMERARPGEELGRSVREEEQDVVVAGLLRQMWVPPAAGHPFRPLSQMCAMWADEAEKTPTPRLDPGVFRAGVELFRTLPTEPHGGPDVLLLTDLHGGNILSAQRQPWLVIDPKPYVGDPAYDPLQHLFNCQGRVLADPVGTAHRLADLCGVDQERFQRWLFARWVIESSWAQPGDLAELVEVAIALAP